MHAREEEHFRTASSPPSKQSIKINTKHWSNKTKNPQKNRAITKHRYNEKILLIDSNKVDEKKYNAMVCVNEG